ncbi:MAG: hypothetical protein AB7U73_11740 [Pirellulales bacterium]
MLAARCPHCHHDVFAADEAELAASICPACQQLIGAATADGVALETTFGQPAYEAIDELPQIDTGEPEAAPEILDRGVYSAPPLTATSDNPYAAPHPVDGGDPPPAKPVQKRELADLYERFVGALAPARIAGMVIDHGEPDYVDAFRERRRRARAFWLIFFLFWIPIFVFANVLSWIVGIEAANLAGVVAWGVVVFTARQRYLSWKCPRCGLQFHTNAFRRTCGHCGLSDRPADRPSADSA